MSGLLRKSAVPLSVYSAATIILTWPIARDADTRIFTPLLRLGTLLMDVLHINWILAWGAHAIATTPLTLFDANILYPTPGAFALSEHLLGGIPIYGSVLALSGNNVLAYNCWILASFILAGFFTHLLMRRWTGLESAAYVAGLAFAFAPWRFPKAIGLPHLLQLQYFPLILLAVDSIMTHKRHRDGVALGLILGVQTLSSYYLGYQAFLIVALFIIAQLVTAGPRALLSSIGALMTSAVVAMLVILPLTIPYLTAAARVGIRTMDWSDQFMSLWATISQWQAIQAAVGPGTLAMSLLAVPLALLRGVNDRDTARRLTACVLIATAGVLLMRGPLGLFGSTVSPYSLLATVVPGFENMRAPGRFVYLLALAAAVLSGYLISLVAAFVPLRLGRALIATSAAGAVLFPIANASLPDDRAYSPPAVTSLYRWLAENGEGGPLLELDRFPGLRNYLDARTMFESRHHWLPLVNGYTSHIPAYYEMVIGLAKALPDPDSLDKLVECTGVRWIITGQLDPAQLKAWRALDGVRTTGTFPSAQGRGHLFEIRRKVDGPCRQHLLDQGVTTEGRVAEAPAQLRGTVRIEAPDPWHSGTKAPVTVVVRNDGDSTWPTTAIDTAERVIVQLRWKNPAGNPAPAWSEIVLPRDLARGDEIRVQRWETAPTRAGTYFLAARIWVHRRQAERSRDWRALIGRLKADKQTRLARSRNRSFDMTSTPSFEVPIRVVSPPRNAR